MVSYQREEWAGKLYVVARSKRGHVLMRRRWSRSFTITDGQRVFQESFKGDVKRKQWTVKRELLSRETGVVETTRWSLGGTLKDRKQLPPKPAGKVQYVVELTTKQGTFYGRSSKSFERTESLRRDAWDSAYANAGAMLLGDSDPGRGEAEIAEDIIRVREGWVKYTGPSYKGGEGQHDRARVSADSSA